MTVSTDCLIVGAGPYGLSLAAHLRAMRVGFRIVGVPMGPWITAMPAGMYLKSEGFASGLFEPDGRFTLGAYCAEQGVPYADIGEPVKLDTFIAYGQAFQQRFVPTLEDRVVVSVRRTTSGFEAVCADGGSITARRLIVAAGILDHAYTPPALSRLPGSLRSHSSDHHDLSRFAGSAVAVIGAGASAMDVAAALHREAAAVTVLARRASVRFQTPLGARSLRDKIRAPMTVVGPGWKSVFCTQAPLLFHAMPDGFRTDVVRRYLGPAPGWFVREQVEGHVPIITGTTMVDARVEDGRARLTWRGHDGQTSNLIVDHVIAATGFRIAVERIGFLDPALVAEIRQVDGAPRLSRHFEASIPGLHFIGPASANSFGPLLRFAAGAGFTARRLSRHLATSPVRQPATRTGPAPQDAVTADG